VTGAHDHPRSWRSAAPISTRRLLLREPEFGDVSRIARHLAEPSVASMLASIPSPFTEAHASVLVGDLLTSNERGDALALAIARRRDPGTLMGLISFSKSGSAAEIGWWLGPRYWGRGFASEAAVAMIEVAFRDESLDRLSAGAFADNPASLRMQTRLGFRSSGQGRRFCVARAALTDHINMVLTREDHLAAAR
jgi:RimJ/RimL family protein N-acetyltransferase